MMCSSFCVLLITNINPLDFQKRRPNALKELTKDCDAEMDARTSGH